MPIYMNYDSLAIKGSVTEEGHKDWIEVNSFQWGVGRGISTPTGSGADREASAPSVSEITLTKPQDNATGKLLEAALGGEGKSVVIDFTRVIGKQTEVYMTYTLENTMISGFSTSSGGDRPSESLSLNFTKFEVKTISQEGANKAGTPSSVKYDIAKARIA